MLEIGGQVSEITVRKELIHIYTGFAGGHRFSISVEKDENSTQVKEGDRVWWTGGRVLWTSADRETEIEIELIRYKS